MRPRIRETYCMYFIAVSDDYDMNFGVFLAISTKNGMMLQCPNTRIQFIDQPDINPDTLMDFSNKFTRAADELFKYTIQDDKNIEIYMCMDSGDNELRVFNFPMSYRANFGVYKKVLRNKSKVYVQIVEHPDDLWGCQIATIHPVQDWEIADAFRDDMSKHAGTFQMQVGQQMKDAGLDVRAGDIANEPMELSEPPLKKSKPF